VIRKVSGDSTKSDNDCKCVQFLVLVVCY